MMISTLSGGFARWFLLSICICEVIVTCSGATGLREGYSQPLDLLGSHTNRRGNDHHIDYEAEGWADGLSEEELGMLGRRYNAEEYTPSDFISPNSEGGALCNGQSNRREGCSSFRRSLATKKHGKEGNGLVIHYKNGVVVNTTSFKSSPQAAGGAPPSPAASPNPNNSPASPARKAPLMPANISAAISQAKADIEKHIAEKHLSGHLQKTVPKDSKALFDGYMLNIENFPIVHNVRTNIEWSEFKDVVLLKSSAAYDIFLGTWEKQRVIIKRVMNSSVASKVQPRKGSHTEMEMEINLLSRMNHPNIIRILGSGTKPLRFSVLEYLSGGTLSALLNYTYHDHQYYGTPIPKAKAFEYGIKIASALAYMHEDWHKAARIFHRDLKTDNIAFTASGEIKLFDFGLAKGLRKTIFDDEDAVFPFGQGAGSWRYMAPEVALGEPYNHKSDVYSYSMILYHLLRGKHPVPNDMNRTEHYNEFYLNYWRPDFSLSLFRNWPLQLTRLLSRAWNYDIRVRPNFKEIVADLNIIEKKFVDVGSTKLHHSGPRFVEYKEPSSKQ